MTSMEYVAAGANRHPSAADWVGFDGGDGEDGEDGLMAFGSGRNIALWRPESNGRGVETLLVGHTDTVNAVKFLKLSPSPLIISGAVDKSVRIWHRSDPSEGTADRTVGYRCAEVVDEHQSSINCIAVNSAARIFATGSADATLKVWKVDTPAKGPTAQLLQSIKVTPRFFPLALALSPLDGTSNSFLLAVAGTAAFVQLYIADSFPEKRIEFKLQATLSGHEGWIRSLSFRHENDGPGSDLLLASASQDKYIRLWRVHQGVELPAVAAAGSDPALGAFLPGKSLSNKAHRFTAGGADYSATFEALLLGHEDWIYSAIWRPRGDTLQLLSASADNSLAIWEQDPNSSVWVSVARLGEISAQKGSTTATGSTGGFWTGLWSPSGQTVACLGRTGSWRLWKFDNGQDRWIQDIGVSGHTQAVTGIAWSRRGDYLISTSSDQTTRLHARWKRNGQATWHEMARPQIHGYDLNCIDTLGESQFVSGADEKLLRVFQQPKAVADLLERLCAISSTEIHSLPDAANMPVLGLSNKAISAPSPAAVVDDEADHNGNNDDDDDNDPAHPSSSPFTDSVPPVSLAPNIPPMQPPTEDHLSKHTLFPETEKLYGHGYEISALACSHSGSVVATACKASSREHAVIRLFRAPESKSMSKSESTERTEWRELKPPLAAHALTVTRLRFSRDDSCLLSVGRDRGWAVFDRRGGGGGDGDGGEYKLLETNPKAHSRMLLDAAWAPPLGKGKGKGNATRAFATAGRDRLVKLWAKDDRHHDHDHDDDHNHEPEIRNKPGTAHTHAHAHSSSSGYTCRQTIQEASPITALDFSPAMSKEEGYNANADIGSGSAAYAYAYLAVGTETGQVAIYRISLGDWVVERKWAVDVCSSPSKAITQLAWRPSSSFRGHQQHEGMEGDGVLEDDEVAGDNETELAVASEDCSLRIYALKAVLLSSSSASSIEDDGVC